MTELRNSRVDQQFAQMQQRRAEREARRQAAQERHDKIVTQIAQVLADNKAVLSELPDIWDSVYDHLTVCVPDQKDSEMYA